MADKDDDAGQASGPADGRRRREPPTIDVKAVEIWLRSELKAQVAGYATVFEVAAIIVILGSFTALLINVPKESITAEHKVVAE